MCSIALAGGIGVALTAVVSCHKEVVLCDWLEGFFIDGVVGLLQHWGDAEVDQAARDTLTDVLRTFSQGVCHWETKQARIKDSGAAAFARLKEVVVSLQTIVKSGTMAPADVTKAITVLENNDNHRLQAGFLKTTCGQTLWAEATAITATGALDTASSMSLQKAVSVLKVDIMPKRATDEDSYSGWLVTIDELANGKVASLLMEALSSFMESLSQWSATGIERSIDEITEFWSLFMDHLKVSATFEWHEFLAKVNLLEPWEKLDDEWTALSEGDAGLIVPNDCLNAAKVYLDKATTCSSTRVPFLSLLSRVDENLGVLSTLSTALSSLQGEFDNAGKVVEMANMQHRVRANINEEIETICKLMLQPHNLSLNDLVQEVSQDGLLKSHFGMALKIAETRTAVQRKCSLDKLGFTYTKATDDIGLHERVEFDDGNIATFLGKLSSGVACGVSLCKFYLHDKLKEFKTHWISLVDPAIRCQALIPSDVKDIHDPAAMFVKFLGPKGHASLFEHINQAIENCTDAGRVFDSLPHTTVNQIMVNFAKHLSPERFDDMGLFCTAYMGKVTRASYISCFEAHTRFAKVIGVTAWLVERMSKEKSIVTLSVAGKQNVVTYTVHPFFKQIFGILRSEIEQCEHMVESVIQEKAVPDDDDIFGTESLLDPLRERVIGFKEHGFPVVFDVVLSVLCERLRQVTSTTSSLAPNWKFYIDDTRYNKNLAKRHLLIPSCRDVLPEQVNSHFIFVASLAEAFAHWKLPPPAEHEVMQKDMAESSEVLKYGQDTVAVSTSVAVLEQTPASQRAQSAAAILEVVSEQFPGTLRKLLVAAKQGR